MTLRTLTLTRTRSGLYLLHLITLQGPEVQIITDKNLGHIMGAISAGLKELWAQAYPVTQAADRRTEILTSPNSLDNWTISTLTMYPLRWQMKMRAQHFHYTANMDHTLDSFIATMSGAMKFFGMKFGYITIDDDGTARPRRPQ